MTNAAPAVLSQQGKELPYVGLRPFERSESDRLFGRTRDAQILCDRTLSSRIIILYAQSGLGKSSLLRALVAPKLEASKAHVVYFDSWAQEDPSRALRDMLVEFASRLGVPDPGRGSPTLIELVRLINNVDDQSTVLILDQFEEFLVHHGQALDPLRSELAALVRSPGVDASVVLSLREEFLAALEPFRQHILNLFQGAYRLEPLAETDLRDAICRPAESFGGHCDPAMAERLIRDLREGQTSTAGTTVPLVELPMLQLVCQELWKHAEGGQLSDELYQTRGGAHRILDAYVRDLMPRTSREQSLTARLLVPLAPPSGLKMSYAAEDLSIMTGLDRAATTAELERLSRARILRPRQHRGGQRFELEHDAFIPVLSSWRDHVLERDRRRKVIRRALSVSSAVIAIFLGLLWYSLAKARDAERAAMLQTAFSANDPLTSALALGELGEFPIAEQAIAQIHQVAASPIPAAVLREYEPPAKEASAAGTQTIGDIKRRLATLSGTWFMPDAERIATVSEDGVLKLWHADGRGNPAVKQIAPTGGGAVLTAVAASQNGQWIAAAMTDGYVRLGPSTGTNLKSLPMTQDEGKITALALSSNAEHILAGYDDGHVKLWDRDGTRATIFGTDQNRHTSQISSIQFDPSGERALSASFDGSAKIWAIHQPHSPLITLRADPSGIAAVSDPQAGLIDTAAFSPDGKWVVCGFQGGRALIFSSDGKGVPIELKGHDKAVSSTAFSPDGKRLATGSADRTARIWELRHDSTQLAVPGSGLMIVGSPTVLMGHAGPISAVAFSPDGSKIVTASEDGTARVWWSESKEPRILGKHANYVEKVAFSDDGKRVASASRDKTVGIWTLDGSIPPVSLQGATDWVRSVAFSPDGKTALTASEDGEVRVWNLETREVQAHRQVDGLFHAAFSPRDASVKSIITATRGKGDVTVKVWPASLAEDPLFGIDAHKEWVFWAGFSPDQSRIVTTSIDESARIWTLDASKRAVKGDPVSLQHAKRVLSAAFSPDGGKIATSSIDRTARVWDLKGKLIWEFPHLDEVWQIGFSSDGKWLVTSSIDKTAKIWDLEYGFLRLTLSHGSGVRAAAFRPKSSDVVTGDDGGGVYLWRTTLHELIEYMRGATSACLTPQERVRLLNELSGKARAAYEQCEAGYGRSGPTN
jgi:WD40 repeat protein